MGRGRLQRVLRVSAPAFLIGLVGSCSAGKRSSTGATGGAGGSGGGAGFKTPDGKSQACQDAAMLRTSVGCDYYAVDMDALHAADNGCFVAFVANTSPQTAVLGVSFGGESLDISKFAKIPVGSGRALSYADIDPSGTIPAGAVAILFLAGNTGDTTAPGTSTTAPVKCPFPTAVPAGAQIHGTGLGEAFHITSSVPVVAYQMLPYGGGAAAVTGASLLLPTSAWDTSYVAVNAYAGEATGNQPAGPSMNIVAMEDDTHVDIVPKATIFGGPGVASAQMAAKATYTLKAGQTLQFTQSKELTGSPIQSDKPIGLWAGHQCADTPLGSEYCDHAEQQIPAVRALGNEYAAVTYRQRNAHPENPPYRIVAAADGTELTFEPDVGGPKTLSFGDVAEFATAKPFVVRSQDSAHPFVVLSYMTGANTVIAPGIAGGGYGDPDVVRVVPPAQYLSRYVFFTDPTYPETNLVVVRKRGAAGFADVKLDCAGVLTGWTPFGASGTYEYTRTDLVRHNFAPQGACDNGRHEMTSDLPFGLSVWGWGSPESQPGMSPCDQSAPGYTCYVSYGYPAGEGLGTLNQGTVPIPQ